MQNKTLQMKRALRTALLVLLLSVAGMGKGYAGIIDTIGNIVYEFVGPSPASPCPYPYNAAIVRGHIFGTDATGSLVIPEFVHFMGNENLALVPVARICPDAFAGCSGLTSITLPNSLEEILYGAFYGCSGLTGNLEIPSSVLSIGAVYYSEWTGNYDPWVGAFEGCNFTSVTIKATTPPILSNEWSYYIDPFNNVPCSNLTVPCECIPVYESSEWHYHFTTIVEDCQATFTIGNLNYIINSDGTTVTVTGHVDGTAATGSLVIPESVNYQGTSYPVTRIGDSAFMGCHGLTSLALPDSVIEIGHHAFSFCSSFTGDLVLPNSLTTIGWSAFAGCSSLNSLTLPNSVTTIDNTAFSNCSGLTSLSIPNSVASIGENPFAYCYGLEQIVVEPGNTVYDSRNNCNAIVNTETNEIISGCMNSFIPNSVTAIGNSAFTGCHGLTSFTLPDFVTTIGEKAFWDCNGLTSLIFPNSVTTIGERAFYYCNGLTNIISLATTPPVLGNEVFSGVSCTMLTILCGCVPAYEVSDWANYFTTIEDDCASHDINIDESNISGGDVSTSVNSTNVGEEVQIIVTPEEGMMLLSLILCNSDNPNQQVYVYPIGKSSLTYGFIMPPFDVIITATFGPATTIGENNEALASVYPNPTKGQIQIEAESLKHITIRNMLGQIIYNSNTIGNTFEYDFNKHEAGIYLIRIETAKGLAVKKVSVTR